MKAIPSYIKEEGVYAPKSPDNLWGTPNSHFFLEDKPLRYLIENDHVFQDENGDWVLVKYSCGWMDTEDYSHWEKTGYARDWGIFKWQPDTDLDEPFTHYYHCDKSGREVKHFRVTLNSHYYDRIIRSSGYWSEGVDRKCNTIYYGDSMGNFHGKFPVKIGKKVQELRDKGIEFGYYKF
jgi:hypothetical protein